MPTPSIKLIEIEGVLHKRCPKCRKTKALDEFSKDSSKNCGYSVVCRPCSKRKFALYYDKNKEKDKADSQRWRAENREWSRESSADWKARNVERVQRTQAAHCRSLSGRYVRARATAKRRDVRFDITFEEYKRFLECTTCHYCEGPLNETGIGLDRKDSTLAYTVDNCVICCMACNRIKNEYLSYEEMLAVAKLLKQMRTRSVAVKPPTPEPL